METVYRIEEVATERGLFGMGKPDGVFKINSIPSLIHLVLRHNVFPSAAEDSIIKNFFKVSSTLTQIYNWNDSKYRFSFNKIDDIKKWITQDEILILNSNGFRIYKIDAKEVIRSDFQAIFNINSVIKKEDITSKFLI